MSQKLIQDLEAAFALRDLQIGFLTEQANKAKEVSEANTQRAERLEEENRSLKLHILRMQRAATENTQQYFKERHSALLVAHKILDREKDKVEAKLQLAQDTVRRRDHALMRCHREIVLRKEQQTTLEDSLLNLTTRVEDLKKKLQLARRRVTEIMNERMSESKSGWSGSVDLNSVRGARKQRKEARKSMKQDDMRDVLVRADSKTDFEDFHNHQPDRMSELSVSDVLNQDTEWNEYLEYLTSLENQSDVETLCEPLIDSAGGHNKFQLVEDFNL